MDQKEEGTALACRGRQAVAGRAEQVRQEQAGHQQGTYLPALDAC